MLLKCIRVAPAPTRAPSGPCCSRPQVNSNGGQPYVLRRSLTIYGNVQGARPSFDFAYVGAIIQLPAGTTFTLRGEA